MESLLYQPFSRGWAFPQ